MNIFGCFFGHKWKYEEVRQIVYEVQRMLMDVKIGEPFERVDDRQYRICTVCGVTQDTKVKEY